MLKKMDGSVVHKNVQHDKGKMGYNFWVTGSFYLASGEQKNWWMCQIFGKKRCESEIVLGKEAENRFSTWPVNYR